RYGRHRDARLAATPVTELEREDIQGLVARGYSNLKAASYLMLRVDEPTAARGWLGDVVARVTGAPVRAAESALNLAFTAAGLQRLGLPDAALAQFSNQFTAGMTTPHRQR